MQGVVLRTGGYWFNKQIAKKRFWVNLETRDYAEAVQKATHIALNPEALDRRTPLETDVDKFFGYKKSLNKYSRNSASSKRYTLIQFAKWLPPGTTLSDIKQSQVDAYYAHLRKNVKDSTADGYMMTLRSFFRWAIEKEHVRISNPVKKVEMARITRRSQKPWCRRDLKNRLIRKAPNDELRFILFAGFDGALRREEIVEARCDWFDLKSAKPKKQYYGCIHVRKADEGRVQPDERPFLIKDREERMIPLTKEFYSFLREYLKGLKPLEFVLYPDKKHGKWRYRYDFRRPFHDYMKKMDCTWVTPHIMRHSFASILASEGTSLLKIAEWLGDKHEVVHDSYVHMSPHQKEIHSLSPPG